MQRHTIGKEKILRKKNKVLLGLVPEINKDYSNWNLNKSVQGYSRPDAWIYGDNFVVLVENKIIGDLDILQMRRHFQILKATLQRNPKFIIHSWKEIHGFFKDIMLDASGKNKWLINQFIKYLEYIGMSDFVGFTDEIFDYFITHDDEDMRKWVKSTFLSFAKKLQPKLSQIDQFYSDFDMGVLHINDPSTWVAFGPDNKEYRNCAHLTIALNSQGLEVFVNIELKSATDRLKKKLKNNRDKFREIIKGLPPDDLLWIQIEERTKKQVVVYDYNLITKIQIKSLKDDRFGKYGFEYLENSLGDIPLPYFSIRKQYPRNKVVELSKKDNGKTLLEEIIQTAKDFHRLISYINL